MPSDAQAKTLCDAHPLPPNGHYTIQQKSTGRYLDASQRKAVDFRLVTKSALSPGDKTQQWLLARHDDNTYTIQQSTELGRYMDAHESRESHYRVVTRERQDNDSQRWLLTHVGGNTYRIQQKSSGRRYLDAFDKPEYEYLVVTNGPQNDESQSWSIVPVVGMKVVTVTFDTAKAVVGSSTPVLIGEAELPNCSSTPQQMQFQLQEQVEETSSFTATAGWNISVEATAKAQLPMMEVGRGVTLSAFREFTKGKETKTSRAFTQTYPVSVQGKSAVRARAVATKTELDVPYVMQLESIDGKGRWCEEGMWHGVSMWRLRYEVADMPTPDCKVVQE